MVKSSIRAALLARLRETGPLALAGMRAGEVAHTTVDAVEALEPYYSRYLPQRAVASLFPFTILAVIFDEKEGKTTATVHWSPINATEEERETFDKGRESMTGGWTGTFEKLEESLKRAV